MNATEITRLANLHALLLVIDGIMTLINMCVLGMTLKLYSEWYKAHLLGKRGKA